MLFHVLLPSWLRTTRGNGKFLFPSWSCCGQHSAVSPKPLLPSPMTVSTSTMSSVAWPCKLLWTHLTRTICCCIIHMWNGKCLDPIFWALSKVQCLKTTLPWTVSFCVSCRSFFELMLFFSKEEFVEAPLKDILDSFQVTKFATATVLIVFSGYYGPKDLDNHALGHFKKGNLFTTVCRSVTFSC